MAVDKLVLASITGKIKYADTFAKDIFLFNDVQIIDAMKEIDAGRYSLPISEENIDELLGIENITQGTNPSEQKKLVELKDKLKSYYQDRVAYNPSITENIELDVQAILERSEQFLLEIAEKSDELEFTQKQLEETNQSLKAYSYLKDIDVPMRELNDLTYFTYSIGSLTEDNANRFRLIFPTFPSVVFELGTTSSNETVFMVIAENNFRNETERILKALDFKELQGFNSAYQGLPESIISMLNDKKTTLERDIEVLEAVQNGLLRDTQEEANLLFNELSILQSVNEIKDFMAFSETSFYFSGWVPVRKKKDLEKVLKKYPNIIIAFTEPNAKEKPPTKLRNSWFFKPFEQLVKMYGVPNYKELDPTPFLSITYIFCFGYMFGDVGQGLVLLIAGWIAEKKGISLGGVATRVSIASIFFGFMYGSVFGLETIIPALWIRPMESTYTLLIAAVVCGVVMLIISYIYSLINKRREHEIEEEYFGKNGISGFAIYLLILLLTLMLLRYVPSTTFIDDGIILVIVLLTIVVFLAQPLTNLVKHKKFSNGIDGQYYVSSFFEVFEMYLSMLSNTLSFIRVGAFALTHVGLFIAFQTIANMAGGGVTGVIVLIIGNIFVIVLEGLIDFIQCLRLQFYELFGKYYQGDGTEFLTVREEINRINEY